MSSDRDEFLAAVAARANVPDADAADLVSDFLSAIAGAIDEDAWEAVRALVPTSSDERAPEAPSSATIEEMLIEMSGEEGVAEDRVASHARAVAMAVRDRASTQQLRRLAELIQDDTVLALFEEHRGELTSVPEPSDGDVAQHTPPLADPEA